MPVELDLNLGPPPGQQVEAAAYIASEAFANAAKHAQATVIDLRVHGDDSALDLAIRDDGIGGADPSRGTGITGLKDRVEALGGTISVLSPPGHGTTLHVRLPAGPSPVTRADGGWREDTVTDAGGYPGAREPEGYRPTYRWLWLVSAGQRMRCPVLWKLRRRGRWRGRHLKRACVLPVPVPVPAREPVRLMGPGGRCVTQAPS